MPSTALDAAAAPGRPPELDLLLGPAGRLMLAGHPGGPPTGSGQILRPKELPMALAAALAREAGLDPRQVNPHFTPLAGWDADLAVAHFCGIETCCPLPRARNTLLLDGEDLLALAEERRSEDAIGLHRRRVMLMDAVLGIAPPGIPAEPLLGHGLPPAPVAALLRGLPLLAEAARPPAPVQWMECDLETGHYNFLELKRRPKLGTSHAAVLLDPAMRGGAAAALAFATPATLEELGPVLRAFAALRAGAAAGGPQLFLLFFGSPEEFAAALAARPDALFFGDNFRCPAIRILFAPFAATDVLAAIQGAEVAIDTVYGGVLDALARGLAVPNRLLLGPGGTVEAHRGDAPVARGIAWEAVLAPATLARRRHKADRGGERLLAELLEAML